MLDSHSVSDRRGWCPNWKNIFCYLVLQEKLAVSDKDVWEELDNSLLEEGLAVLDIRVLEEGLAVLDIRVLEQALVDNRVLEQGLAEPDNSLLEQGLDNVAYFVLNILYILYSGASITLQFTLAIKGKHSK